MKNTPNYLGCIVTFFYSGYLMGERRDHPHPSTYECVDQDPDYIPGEAAEKNGGYFYLTTVFCNQGLLWPPYVDNKAITCVVCTQ